MCQTITVGAAALTGILPVAVPEPEALHPIPAAVSPAAAQAASIGGTACKKLGQIRKTSAGSFRCSAVGKQKTWRPLQTAATTTTTIALQCFQRGTCTVGDTGPGGGVIFYDAGSTQSWGRYLEVAPASWMSSQPDARNWWRSKLVTRPWGCINTNITTGTAIGTGRSNTIAISAACAESNAANLVKSLTINGLSDWFLPSLDELNLLVNRPGVFSTTSTNLYPDYEYWSSSQATEPGAFQVAWGCRIPPDICWQNPKVISTITNWGLGVIPIRAFS